MEEAPPIILNMYDADDKKGISRDFLGAAIINIADGIKEGWIIYDSMKTPEPKFIDLQLSKIYFENYIFLKVASIFLTT